MNKIEIDLKQLLSAVDVSADWVGLREVYEKVTPRMIRDGVPVANGTYTTQGVMVEVLVNGQFGYFGTSNISKQGISDAAQKAYMQAKLASKHALVSFTEAVRPAFQGKYQSPFVKNSDTLSPGEMNEMLLKMNEALKVSDKIVSASSIFQIIETQFKGLDIGDIYGLMNRNNKVKTSRYIKKNFEKLQKFIDKIDYSNHMRFIIKKNN